MKDITRGNSLTQSTCPECGTAWQKGLTCEDYFHQMLYWENENPALGVVHHLMVLAYHLQHPSLYSPEGLTYSLKLLVNFVEGGVSPDEVLKNDRAKVDSGRREWKIRSTTRRKASYHPPVSWTMTAQDVVSAGVDQYMDSVQDWAKSILSDLRSTANLE